MDLPTTAAWAKLSPRQTPTRWHPLISHSHDVAACCEAILAIPIVARRLASLAGWTALPRTAVDRLVVLAFLHDLGKANHDFQDRRGGHLKEAAYPAMHDDACRAAGLDLIDPWSDDPLELVSTILAHHGAGIDVRNEVDDAQGRVWIDRAGRSPLATVQGLVADARATWPAAFDAGGETLPAGSPFWHAFLGVLQLADWLGSDDRPDAFPFTNENDSPRRPSRRLRGRALVKAVGLDAAALRHPGSPVPDFSAVSDFPPYSIQRATGEADARIVLLEAETGAGKTEAALYRFVRLFAEGRVDGLYFALPTRVAATQMFARVKAAVHRLFPDDTARPPVVLAVPGDCGADDAKMRPRELPGFDVEWNDDPAEATRRRRWAAEHPKRFLAAPIAVGTIDQALLGAVRVKHAQMRSVSLMRSLFVVDEVHASDTYMTGLLTNLLRQHLAAGGEALLLSATLGGEVRSDLMLSHLVSARDLGAKRPSFEAALRVPYPALSHAHRGETVTQAHASRGAPRRIRVVPTRIIADPGAIAAEALAAARAGARVLVVATRSGTLSRRASRLRRRLLPTPSSSRSMASRRSTMAASPGRTGACSTSPWRPPSARRRPAARGWSSSERRRSRSASTSTPT